MQSRPSLFNPCGCTKASFVISDNLARLSSPSPGRILRLIFVPKWFIIIKLA